MTWVQCELCCRVIKRIISTPRAELTPVEFVEGATCLVKTLNLVIAPSPDAEPISFDNIPGLCSDTVTYALDTLSEPRYF